MALTARQLLALKFIPSCGVKSVKKIADISVNNKINSVEGLVSLFNKCIEDKIITRIKQYVTVEEMQEYLNKADDIFERSEELGIHAITFQDVNFPKSLINTINEEGKKDIPILLYYKGDIKVANLPGIAIIGTREPTKEGIIAGKYLGKMFAQAGFNIVSGLAIGCDTSGHKGALQTVNGKTTAFLAHGLDTIYPAENKELADEIVVKGGLLMSEYPIGTMVNRYNLVARDRLQAALASATIVIQTGIKGGTMHAVTSTILAGKPLFCVKYKGQDGCPQTEGNELLANKGLKLIIKNKKVEKEIFYKAKYITSEDAIELVGSEVIKFLHKSKENDELLSLF